MTKKITKVEALTAILALVKDNADLTAFVEHELDLLAKKSAKSAEKSAEKLAEYATLADTIKSVLADTDSGLTVTEIVKATGLDITGQRVTYVLTKYKDIFTKTTVKGKSYYKLAE